MDSIGSQGSLKQALANQKDDDDFQLLQSTVPWYRCIAFQKRTGRPTGVFPSFSMGDNMREDRGSSRWSAIPNDGNSGRWVTLLQEEHNLNASMVWIWWKRYKLSERKYSYEMRLTPCRPLRPWKISQGHLSLKFKVYHWHVLDLSLAGCSGVLNVLLFYPPFQIVHYDYYKNAWN